MSNLTYPLSREQVLAMGVPKIWDNSMRQLLLSCPRKLMLTLQGYDYAKHCKPAYFVYGQIWGQMLNKWYKAEGDPDCLEEVERYGERLWARSLVMQDGENSWDHQRQKFRSYICEYPVEQFRLIGDEQGFEFPIPGTPYSYGGALDGMIEWPGYGYMFREDKTTSSYLGQGTINSYYFSAQVKGYCWYGKQIMGDDFWGVAVNLMTKKRKGPKSNWSTPEFTRPLIEHGQDVLDDFIQSVYFDIKTRAEPCWELDVWPMAADSMNCTGGPGKSPCLFRHLCKRDVPFWDLDPLMDQSIHHRNEPWEPWKRHGEETQ